MWPSMNFLLATYPSLLVHLVIECPPSRKVHLFSWASYILLENYHTWMRPTFCVRSEYRFLSKCKKITFIYIFSKNVDLSKIRIWKHFFSPSHNPDCAIVNNHAARKSSSFCHFSEYERATLIKRKTFITWMKYIVFCRQRSMFPIKASTYHWMSTKTYPRRT